MINCLDCGFCVVECSGGRRFDQRSKSLQIDGCVQCGRCLRLNILYGMATPILCRVVVEGVIAWSVKRVNDKAVCSTAVSEVSRSW